MTLEIIILISLGSVILVLILINGFLFWHCKKVNKRINDFLEGGKIKDLRDILLKQKDKNASLDEEIKEAFLKIKSLEELSEIAIQKVGIIRFNPFKDMGGNQSFIIALLDKQDNGFVISSLFVNESNRVYAKSVNKGKSDYKLSEEELKAIDMAMNPEKK